MRQKQVNPQITHVMADGKVLTNEEFMSKPYIVVAEDNYEFHVRCNRALDPNYWTKERMRKKWERAEARRAELEAQQARIASELSAIHTGGDLTKAQKNTPLAKFPDQRAE